MNKPTKKKAPAKPVKHRSKKQLREAVLSACQDKGGMTTAALEKRFKTMDVHAAINQLAAEKKISQVTAFRPWIAAPEPTPEPSPEAQA